MEVVVYIHMKFILCPRMRCAGGGCKKGEEHPLVEVWDEACHGSVVLYQFLWQRDALEACQIGFVLQR